VSLVRTGFLKVPPADGPGFDHADVYRRGRRVYVAHTGGDRVDVIDCVHQRFLRSLTNLPGVAGLLIDEDHDLLFTSDREAARVTIFRCSDEELMVRVGVGQHPNGLAYDRRRRRVYAFNLGEPVGEGCTVTVIALASKRVIAEFSLPGRPRWAVYDPERDRVYVNIRDPPRVGVIDPERMLIERSFDVPSEGPHGLWLDSGRLFCAADGGDLITLDCASGEVLATLPLPGPPDVLMHDPGLRRLYVAIGDPGVVASFDTGPLDHLETVETEGGAHTMALDPVAHRLYVLCPSSRGAMVYEERI
jgi:serine/threonine-protein kinase